MKNQFIVPSISNSSIFVETSDIPTNQEYDCSMHVHGEYEILKVLEGKVYFYTLDEEYQLASGDVIFVNSYIPHGTIVHKNTRSVLVQFGASVDADRLELGMSKYLLRFLNGDNKNVVLFEKKSEIDTTISSLLDKVFNEYIMQEESYEAFIKAHVCMMIAELERHKIIKDAVDLFDSQNLKKVIPALSYAEEHYREEISLETASRVLHLNEYYFCRLFKKTVNTSFLQYLNFVRVCKAEKLLLTTNKSISEIALETGFSSSAYFNRIFKKYKSCTPKFYRNIKFSRR